MCKFIIIFFILNFLNLSSALVEFNLTNLFPKSNEILNETRLYYKINTNDHFEFDVTKYFIFGFVVHSFECTFRIRNESLLLPYLDDWYLYDIHSNFGNRFYLALSATRKELVFYADSYKDVSNAVFPNIEIFDGKWHSIMYTVLGGNFKLYVDCELRSTKSNATKTKIHNTKITNPIRLKRSIEPDVYKEYDDDDLYDYSSPEIDVIEPKLTIEIARGVNSKNTFPIDISKMRFHPYPQMPAFAGCEDVDNSHRQKFQYPNTKIHNKFNHNIVKNGITKNYNFCFSLIIISIIFLFSG